MTDLIPVICIDGPSGSGKGTLSQLLAKRLGWHLLDSGALYRVLVYSAEQQGIALDNALALQKLAQNLSLSFRPTDDEQPARIFIQNHDVSSIVRSEVYGNLASKIALMPEVRDGLMQCQRHFQQAPGLVADGRDMGTVVFPDSPLKFFLTASATERTQRRYKQLKDKGIDVNIEKILSDLQVRDQRDSERSVAPLRAAEDAVSIDTTDSPIQEVFSQVWDVLQSRKVGTDI